MTELELAKLGIPLDCVKGLLSFEAAASFLRERTEAILVVLNHVKATDWPWKGLHFANNPVTRIPLTWGLFRAIDDSTIVMSYDVHSTKCMPKRYNESNPNSNSSRMPIHQIRGRTLAGCCRSFVMLKGRRYEVAQKTPEYCSAFGLPDDCYDPDFEQRMIDQLVSHNNLKIWCLEQTDFLTEEWSKPLSLSYMKGEFLPAKHFIYKDTAAHFLKGIYEAKKLESLNSEVWYSSGRELINEMNLEIQGTGFRFEEQAEYFIRKRMVFEFLRLLLILMNRSAFSSFVAKGPARLKIDREQEVRRHMGSISDAVKREGGEFLSSSLASSRGVVLPRSLKNARFIVMDIEHVHVAYPYEVGRTFNFPAMFSSLIWEGTRTGLTADLSALVLPCHFCSTSCKDFSRSALHFDCLSFALDFVERQTSYIQDLLLRYDGFQIYTYGRSDPFQLEQADSFFSDSYDLRLYARRNRKTQRRIVDITRDLAVPGTSLQQIEDAVLRKSLSGWSRKAAKVNFNTRFMMKYDSPRWETAYYEAMTSCMLDTVSAFLYLVHLRSASGG